MPIPVYAFTGFLDAGKTKFIQETLEDERFNSGERTLVLVCEEGEEEYAPDQFADPTVLIRVVEGQEQLTVDNLDDVKSYLSIDGKVVGLNRFVSDYLKRSVIGVINTLNLKDFGVDDIGKIELLIPNENTPKNPADAECAIKINDKDLEINSFTRTIVSNSIKGMVSAIKTEDNVRTIDIEIMNIEKELIDADISLKTNGHDVEINEFTQGILKETIFAIISSLKVDEKIKEIKIKVEE
jgi:molybdopterin-guanine dinucleotide biosynthesis protein B